MYQKPAISNLPVVGKPIWRLTEGKHIVKLEIAWQFTPRQPTQRKLNKPKNRDKTVSKMAEPTPEPKMADIQISVTITRHPEPAMTPPPGPTLPTTTGETTDHPSMEEWKVVTL